MDDKGKKPSKAKYEVAEINNAEVEDFVQQLADVEAKVLALIQDQGDTKLKPTKEIVDSLRKAREIIQGSVEIYHALWENLPIGVFRDTPGPEGRILTANPAFLNIFGFDSLEDLKKITVADLYFDPSDRQSFADELQDEGVVTGVEMPFKKKDETPFYGLITVRANYKPGSKEIVYYDSTVEDITGLKMLEETLSKSETRYRILVNNTPDFIFSINKEGRYTAVNESFCQILGLTADEIVGQSNVEAGYFGEVIKQWKVLRDRVLTNGEHVEEETSTLMPDGQTHTYEVVMHPIYDQEGFISGVRERCRDITKQKQAQVGFRKVTRALRVLSDCNKLVIRATDESELMHDICRVIVGVGGYRFTWIGFAEQDEKKTVRLVAQGGFDDGYLDTINLTWADTERCRHPAEITIRTGEPIIVKDVLNDPRFSPSHIKAEKRSYISVLGLPLIANEQTFGVLAIYTDELDAFDSEEVKLLKELADDMAFGITNLRTRAQHELATAQIQLQLRYLAALRDIDLAITSSFDLRVILNVFLDKVTSSLHTDAASVLLLNPHAQKLEYTAGRGFRTNALQHTQLRLGEGYAGRAALTREIVNIPDLRGRTTDFIRSPMFLKEAFVTYYAVPLISKGQVKGVLEIFHRAPLDPSQEWLDFLNALSTQAAIAIDNAELFTGLQQSNVELRLAYDTTIEGWSNALDLRDKETEGHSQRVAKMTVELGRILGLSELELVHVRRGALLHDIGKMGVPDQILLKPGALNEEEWNIMSEHPEFAYKLLSPIKYLSPALDIPYCHHEKWDGTGYPRGLMGDQIPLAARIFAVVDVWDALSSDRPYRQAWPDEKMLAHIKEQTGKHFDPQVAEAFFVFLEGEENSKRIN